MSAAARRPAMPPRLSAVPRSCRRGLAEEGVTLHPVRLGTVRSLGKGGGRTAWEGLSL